MNTMIVILVLLIIVYVSIKYFKKQQKSVKEGFSTGSDYDYLAPVPADAVTVDTWAKFAEKLNSVSGETTYTGDLMKQNYNTNITTDEINSYIQNEIFPLDTYVTNALSDQFKQTYAGSDLDTDLKTYLNEQALNPNRMVYSQQLSNIDAAKSPQPDAYLIYMGKMEPPSTSSDISNAGSEASSMFSSGISSISGSQYDYLAPVPTDAVTDETWTNLANKYNSINNTTTITGDQIKSSFNGFLTTDEINYYIQNGKYPWDTYVVSTYTELFKSTYKGSDFDTDFKNILEQEQKGLPNRYFYSSFLSKTDASKDPQPDAYLIFTGQMAPPSSTSAVSSAAGAVAGPGAYAMQFFSQVFGLFIYALMGTAVLYSAKVAQTNLMPTEKDCEPFQYVERVDYIAPLINVDIAKLKVFGGDLNLFLNKLEDQDIKSTKIRFPYEENIKIVNESLLGFGYLKKTVSDENCSPIMNYLISINKGMVLNMAGNMNAVGNFFNSIFSESVIVFLGSGFYGFIVFLLTLVNIFYGWIYYFTHLIYIFSKKEVVKVEIVVDGQKQFKNMAKWDNDKASINWFMFPMYLMAAILFWGFAWAVAIPILAIVTTFKLLFLPLFFEGKVEGTNEKYNFGTMLKNTLLYKKSLFMYIISFYIVSGASNLGANGLIFSIIACLFVYVFFPDVYKKYIPSDTSIQSTYGLVPYTMAKKSCIDYFAKNVVDMKPEGFINRLFEPKPKPKPILIEEAAPQSDNAAPTSDVEVPPPRPEEVRPIEGGKRRYKNQ